MTDISGSNTVSDGSTSLYTPTTEEVRELFTNGISRHLTYAGAEFDRWLFEMQEDAWDRGYQAGVVDFAAEGTTNPYRQEETE